VRWGTVGKIPRAGVRSNLSCIPCVRITAAKEPRAGSVGPGGDPGWGPVGDAGGAPHVMKESFIAPDVMNESFMTSAEPPTYPQDRKQHPE
jgi:hypothetical protein